MYYIGGALIHIRKWIFRWMFESSIRNDSLNQGEIVSASDGRYKDFYWACQQYNHVTLKSGDGKYTGDYLVN